ncbi:hypothetical protein LXM63_04530 [Chryseobacterium gleum]|uniref:hypothetical protein n=1 Tax=Chryseobacterium gleum TaxID=250 RepID=UPI001E6049BA|nr:hypothetical protein [Chryseobacterium gleum]MCE4064349.1 hypothetical protein [Chryseobacterium gleum]
MDEKVRMLRHIYTGITGIFIAKKMGYFGEVTIIKTMDGREYAAPCGEFEQVNSNSGNNATD